MRPKKVKPAIYEFENSDLVPYQRVVPKNYFPEATWGWVDIKELAEIIEMTPTNLLYVYFSATGGKISHPYHRQINREAGWSLAFAVDQKVDQNTLYEIIYFNRRKLFNDLYFTFLRALLESNIFVPAGWALAVIKTVKADIKDGIDLRTTETKEEKENA